MFLAPGPTWNTVILVAPMLLDLSVIVLVIQPLDLAGRLLMQTWSKVLLGRNPWTSLSDSPRLAEMLPTAGTQNRSILTIEMILLVICSSMSMLPLLTSRPTQVQRPNLLRRLGAVDTPCGSGTTPSRAWTPLERISAIQFPVLFPALTIMLTHRALVGPAMMSRANGELQINLFDAARWTEMILPSLLILVSLVVGSRLFVDVVNVGAMVMSSARRMVSSSETTSPAPTE